MFGWFRKAFGAVAESEKGEELDATANDSGETTGMLFHCDHADFDNDATICVPWGSWSESDRTCGRLSVGPEDSQYRFWCWLLAQPQFRRSMKLDELESAQEAFERLSSGKVASTAPDDDICIIERFAATLEKATERILDAARLSDSKKSIRAAIERRVSTLTEQCSGDASESQYHKEISQLRALRPHVSDFQEIDEGDAPFVAQVNASLLDERRSLLLVLKYHQRGMKEDGLVVEEPLERDGETVEFEALCKRFESE